MFGNNTKLNTNVSRQQNRPTPMSGVTRFSNIRNNKDDFRPNNNANNAQRNYFQNNHNQRPDFIFEELHNVENIESQNNEQENFDLEALEKNNQ